MNHIEHARKLRSIIEQAAQFLPVNDALEAVELYPAWKPDMIYTVGIRLNYSGKLYEVLQAHTSQMSWKPDIMPSLYTAVNETNAGTADDPIPYSGNMALESGKYYTENGVLYLCIRDTGIPVYNALADLVGIYVDVVR